jgi:hypothetical protein
MGASERDASKESSVVVVEESEFRGPGVKQGLSLLYIAILVSMSVIACLHQ